MLKKCLPVVAFFTQNTRCLRKFELLYCLKSGVKISTFMNTFHVSFLQEIFSSTHPRLFLNQESARMTKTCETVLFVSMLQRTHHSASCEGYPHCNIINRQANNNSHSHHGKTQHFDIIHRILYFRAKKRCLLIGKYTEVF